MIIYYPLLYKGNFYPRWTRPLRILFPFVVHSGQKVRRKLKRFDWLTCSIGTTLVFLLTSRFVESFEIFFELCRTSETFCSFLFYPSQCSLYSVSAFFATSLNSMKSIFRWSKISGFFTFRNLKYPNGDDYFTNYLYTAWDLYVLVTTANNPDVM